MCKIEDLKTELKDLQCKYAELQRKLYITKQARDAALRALPDCNNLLFD